MRFRSPIPLALVGLGALVLLAQSAGAALMRYELNNFSIIQFENASPFGDFLLPDVPFEPPPDRAVIDDSGASPVLRKLLFVGASPSGVTTDVPGLSGFIWFASLEKEAPSGPFTGTGSTASSIAWGVTSGWTITGATFCNAAPSFICDLAVGVQLSSIEPPLRSSFYDLGTWVFHGTGFTAEGFILLTATLPGNQYQIIKGRIEPTGAVPALPVLGLGALGASLFAMGLAAMRRGRT